MHAAANACSANTAIVGTNTSSTDATTDALANALANALDGMCRRRMPVQWRG